MVWRGIGGSGRNRTGVRGVAVHYMTTLPPSLIGGGAGNRVRTGNLNLGKAALGPSHCQATHRWNPFSLQAFKHPLHRGVPTIFPTTHALYHALSIGPLGEWSAYILAPLIAKGSSLAGRLYGLYFNGF